MDTLTNLFQQYKKVYEFVREAQNSTNDADALMNYSHSLSLFKQLGNINGIGKVSANIGNLHFKSERYSEAMSHYKEAIKASEKEIEEI